MSSTGSAPRRIVPPRSSISLLVGQQIDDRERRVRVELGGVRVREPDDVAGELDGGALHAEADAEERRARLARVAHGGDLALDRARAEAAGDQDPVDAAEALLRLGRAEALGVDPLDLEVGAVEDRGVLEGLDHREVRVAQTDVLADERDPDATLEVLDAVAQVLPVPTGRSRSSRARGDRSRARRAAARAAGCGTR